MPIALEAARLALMPDLSHAAPAVRYGINHPNGAAALREASDGSLERGRSVRGGSLKCLMRILMSVLLLYPSRPKGLPPNFVEGS
jgi:hypothetical protein